MSTIRTPLVAGNWKMNGDRAMVRELIGSLKESCTPASAVEVVVFPPALLVDETVKAAGSTVAVGLQNVSQHVQGAFTGEISVGMASEAGCTYCLVGHSERRSLYGENNQEVASKFAALKAGNVKPVLCLGETLEQRQAGETEAVVAEQLAAVVDEVGLPAVVDAVIAYEPVWAIGTGKTASPEQAQAVHAFIRQQLGEQGQQTRLLYGGSVNASNAKALFSQPDIDGGLVGGASLDAQEFINVVNAAER